MDERTDSGFLHNTHRLQVTFHVLQTFFFSIMTHTSTLALTNICVQHKAQLGSNSGQIGRTSSSPPVGVYHWDLLLGNSSWLVKEQWIGSLTVYTIAKDVPGKHAYKNGQRVRRHRERDGVEFEMVQGVRHGRV
eukprot:CAMPEP_0174305694 /NCGR_PEP_ID=MMETSP0809-20121228/61560_1 /TAXON_ID=73025 ORGANISM="Eutreptiella gymnastica-like, Strain CCMP1594" /NCGR_SAMPLE_ID=MMETSP0809 /ASSEMBLY_ACC=CAM_ASM_000658 /LENGTH=133 /DNA_ID=CAMNT_0015412211 /DNA_START=255 /DNA_END=657 /DNA_ORIENTATION=-